MDSKLTRFLRSGGGSEIVIGRGPIPWDGGRAELFLKSGIPEAAALRASFAARLDAVIGANAAMLQDRLAGRSGPPRSAAEMPDVSAARDRTLALWDERTAVIWDEWHGQPHRLAPARAAMEAHLLRAFAALINELRQRALGIRQYVWRTRDDDKVRSSHADHDDQVFSWDDPPEGGHPGQAWGCRCHAEPWFGQDVDQTEAVMIPAQFTIIDEGLRGRTLPETGAGLRALTRGGAAALALYGLQVLRTWAEQAAVREAAQALGLDLTTVEGVLAARAYVWGQYNAGLISGADWSGPTAEIAAQAMALYELAHPGALGRAAAGNAEDLAAIQAVIGAALKAFAAGRLVPTEGDLAQGWVEVFPELTEDERRLGQLPGFTPERLDQFREEYPAEGPDLPNHTGQGPARDPTGSIISTPIPEERGPEIVTMERTPRELEALASDPAHGGKVSNKSIREREVGLGAEFSGLVPGPIRRDPSGAAEFIDADGQAWDVKGFRSDMPATSGGFDLTRDIGKVERELAAGHNVIIDTASLNQADVEAVESELILRGIRHRVVFWP